MKYFALLLSCFFLTPIKAQTSDSLMNKFIAHIPSGWKYTWSETALIITKKDTAYRVYHNKINECGNCPGEKEADSIRQRNFKKIGQPVIATVSYRLEKKWTVQKLNASISKNNELQKKIEALPKKYKISHLYDQFASHKGTPTYTAKTPEDEKKINDYENEKRNLEDKMVELPQFYSIKYAIFREMSLGCESATEDFFPVETSRECYSIGNKADSIFLRSL